MDLYTDNKIVYFRSQDNTTIIQLVRTRKPYTFDNNRYSNYNISMNFINSLGFIVFTINCNEKELLVNIEDINQFINNQYNMISDTLYFNCGGDFKSYFWYISLLEFPTDSPTEDDDRLQISIYETYMETNILRYYFETDYDELSNLMYILYTVIEDLPYLYEMINDSMIMELYEIEHE